MKTPFVSGIISSFLAVHLIAGESIEPKSILGTKEVCISDGSSVFIFSPDKTFRLEPIGLSGRTIEGTWSHDSPTLRITGKWSWINGLSAIDDYREMDIHIGYLKENPREYTSKIEGTKHAIHECYFVIERVEKKKKD